MPDIARTFAVIFFLAAVVCSADEAEEPPLNQHGLLASYHSDGATFQRIDSHIALDVTNELADFRLSRGKFDVTWTGQILIPSDGTYRFFAHAIGQVESVEVGEHALTASHSHGWWESNEVHLAAGLKAIRIRFGGTSSRARLVLFWAGPNFAREPIAPRWFVPPADFPQADEYNQYVRGWELTQALQCAACHALPGNSLAAAPIDSFAGNISPEWMVNWLSGSSFNSSSHRMPDFELSVDQARAVTTDLLTEDAPDDVDKLPGNVEKGRQLFLTVGCLACHRVGDLGSDDLLDGGDLSDIGNKRTVNFFTTWLRNPDRISAAHRMPVFELSKHEVVDLTAYLNSLRTSEFTPANLESSDAAAGQRLVSQLGCAACHASERHTRPERTRLDPTLDFQSDHCLNRPNGTRPGYRLSKSDQSAVFASWQFRPHRISLIRKNNCLNCHSRDGSVGNTPIANAVFGKHPGIAPHVAALSAPTLTSIGDKLTDEALANAIRGEAQRLRPWLAIRMPRPALTRGEQAELHRQLVAHDRVPPYVDAPSARSRYSDAALRTAGARLVTAQGFGCASCHDIGKHTPTESPLNARGPQLAGGADRIRPTWFHRWVSDPLRIHPRVEMPAIRIPVRGVLGEMLNDQIAAVWTVLKDKHFTPARPDAVRVVRYHRRTDRTANVLTDGVRINDDQLFIKPILIGLRNRHNVLFDFEKSRLSGWWIGDTARQYNEGKVWTWRSGQANLMAKDLAETDFTLVRIADDKEIMPTQAGQFRAILDGWRHEIDAVIFQHRLRFDLPEKEQLVTIKLTQRISPVTGQSNSWCRQVESNDIPRGYELHWHYRSGSSDLVSIRRGAGTHNEQLGTLVLMPHQAFETHHRPAETNDGKPVPAVIERARVASVTYQANVPNNEFFIAEGQKLAPRTQPVTAVPGFDGVRLSLPEDIMPIALAWRTSKVLNGRIANERLVVCDMKGRVWLATDSNEDGLPDTVTQFGDELATPYGAFATPHYVDVVTKYAALRLWDKDADGVVEGTEVLVDGWGHTDDYHDWAVGLPRTPAGAYLVALPCQQDDRSAAAGALRGRVLRLVPRETTRHNPRRFSIEEISAGHRFAMGIAQNRNGDIFVTDNQGNYNPFNELNHVLRGKHYGFINRLEKKADFKPELTPPAIDIPHPWTRSVNGIAFLETPDALMASGRQRYFGPFEGHLIGCEYDTRRLIRLSLHRVADTVQGAAYPLSYEDDERAAQLTGPITAMIAPNGDIYIGNIRDAGWGGGGNHGNVVRLRPQLDRLPAGIGEVRAEQGGLRIKFTRAVDRDRMSDTSRYAVSSYTRVSTPQYGGDDKHRRPEEITGLVVSDDAKSVLVQLPKWRAGYVYEVRLQNMTADDAEFFPSFAFYTLRVAPQ